MRAAALGAIAVAAFAGVLALTLPTDGLVRAMLARVPLPGGMTLAFARAHLRWRGLVLDDAALRDGAGRTLFAAATLALRPSLRGLWRNGTGRPWRIEASACDGRLLAEVDGDRGGGTASLVVEHVAPQRCVGVLRAALDGSAPLDGATTLRWPPPSPGGGPQIDLDGAARAGDGFRAEVRGTIRLAAVLATSRLDLDLTVVPGRTMPVRLRRLVSEAPGPPADARGARTFRIEGSLAEPYLRPPDATR